MYQRIEPQCFGFLIYGIGNNEEAVRFAGGRGSVVDALLGAFIIACFAHGLILYGLSDFMRQILTGVVMVVIVILDHFLVKLSAS